MFNTKRGVSIYLALIITAILLAIVLGLDAILVGQIKTIRNIGYSVTAFYAAETGIENSLYTDAAVPTTILGNGASYSSTKLLPGDGACPAGADHCFVSVGVFQGTRRAIQVAR